MTTYLIETERREVRHGESYVTSYTVASGPRQGEVVTAIGMADWDPHRPVPNHPRGSNIKDVIVGVREVEPALAGG